MQTDSMGRRTDAGIGSPRSGAAASAVAITPSTATTAAIRFIRLGLLVVAVRLLAASRDARAMPCCNFTKAMTLGGTPSGVAPGGVPVSGEMVV
jgi:hypothetical protein